jgi:hypothetical protein
VQNKLADNGRSGSISTELAEAAGPSMSALPLTATKLTRHNKLSRCAMSRRERVQQRPLFHHLIGYQQ